jgi:hypothetical protein
MHPVQWGLRVSTEWAWSYHQLHLFNVSLLLLFSFSLLVLVLIVLVLVAAFFSNRHESVEGIKVDLVRLATVSNDLVHFGLAVENRLLAAATTVKEDLLALAGSEYPSSILI